jgi:hypothetical protein
MMRRVGLAALVLACVPFAARAGVGVAVGVRVGPGPYFYRPYWGYGYYGYYRPYPLVIAPSVVVGPAPVVAPVPVVAPAPVVVQPTAVAPPAYAGPPTTTSAAPPTPEPPLAGPPPPAPHSPPSPMPTSRAGTIDTYLQQAASPDEHTRAEALVQLGRLKAHRAVPVLTRTLKDDPSPEAREAAARALGLIGDATTLDALQHAAQADDNHDVRRSASFAADVIRTRLQR